MAKTEYIGEYIKLPGNTQHLYLEVVESFDVDKLKYITLFSQARKDKGAYIHFMWRSCEVKTVAIETLREIVQRACKHYGATFDLSSDNIYDWQDEFDFGCKVKDK